MGARYVDNPTLGTTQYTQYHCVDSVHGGASTDPCIEGIYYEQYDLVPIGEGSSCNFGGGWANGGTDAGIIQAVHPLTLKLNDFSTWTLLPIGLPVGNLSNSWSYGNTGAGVQLFSDAVYAQNFGTEEIGLGIAVYAGPPLTTQQGNVCYFSPPSWYTMNEDTLGWVNEGRPDPWTLTGYFNDPSTPCGAMFQANSQNLGGEVQINMQGPLYFGDSGTTVFDIDNPSCYHAIGSLEAIFNSDHTKGVMLDINNQVYDLNNFGLTGLSVSIYGGPLHNWQIFQGTGVAGCTGPSAPALATSATVVAGTSGLEGSKTDLAPVSETPPAWWTTTQAAIANGPKLKDLLQIVDRATFPGHPVSVSQTSISIDGNGNPVWHVGTIGPCGGESVTPALQAAVLAEFNKHSISSVVFEKGDVASTVPLDIDSSCQKD